MKTAVDKIGEFGKFGSVLVLERISGLMEKLGNPQDRLRCIHVAGTNGKGSVCRYIYEVLEASGYKVGIYTSPFIEEFNERIEFDHQRITDDELERYTDMVLHQCKEITDEGHDSPTEFDVVTAIAFCYFADRNPDFVVLEVGLGGRGDSTNIIKKPVVSVITGIAYDHMDRLGGTLEEIAYNKAGIIKNGCPVVSNVDPKEEPGAARVIAREAYEKDAVLKDASKCKVYDMKMSDAGTVFTADILGQRYENVEVSMPGEHQVMNACTALAAIEVLRKNSIIDVTRDSVGEGMKAAFQPGRFEIIRRDTPVLLDGAHNREGMESLVKAADDVFEAPDALTVIGILADKAVDDMLDMAVYLGDDFIVTEPDSPRRMPASELAAKLEARGKRVETIPDPGEAAREALRRSGDYDLVIVAGSLYLIGAVRRFFI